jgi:short-subunit dehydrogenase
MKTLTRSARTTQQQEPTMARRSIADSRILITGASQGIGLALAEAAARRGAKVLAAARSAEALRELKQRAAATGQSLEIVVADVTGPEDRRKMVEAAQQHFGGLDILINNAGVGATGHFVEASPERLRQIMEVNVFGVTETTRECLPLLRQGNKPAIVNISSIAGKRAMPARSEYSASKFAIQGFSEALRAELVKFGIDVIVVAPGLTQTNFSKNMIERKALMQIDHMRGMTPEDVAEATLKAIENGKHETILTLNGKLLAFFGRFLPRIADRIAAKKVRSLFKEEIAAKRQKKS